jgi:hypothetical protein
LIKAVTADRVDVLVLSVTMIANLPSTRDLLAGIRERTPDTRIVVGGRAALKARVVLENYCDAVVSDIDEAHSVCLRLAGGDA